MARKEIDWAAIEPDFRANIKAVLQIGEEHGISHTAINKHFKKLGVTRDLTAKIKAKADAMVSESLVSGQVSIETKMDEKDIIDGNAVAVANVRIGHRVDSARGRVLCMKLFTELETTTDNADLFEQLGEILHSPDKNGVDKLSEIYRKVISMPGRVDSLKKLTDSLKTLIAVEREAFNIDGARDPGEEGGANGGKGNTTNIFIGLQATSGFFGRVATEGSGRTLPQSVQDRPLLPAPVRTQPA